MHSVEINYYARLGLDRGCTPAQIRAAYRLLARHHHPDLNSDAPEAVASTQKLNAAYETLSDPARRLAYDHKLDNDDRPTPHRHAGKIQRNLSQDVNLRIADFLRGAEREVRVTDPANPRGPEIYRLVIPPGTAPGTRFRMSRTSSEAAGFIQLRVRALPDFRFKVRGSDLRCDLRIKPERAAQGGNEAIAGVTGTMLRVQIPAGVARGGIIRVSSEGLPKSRGGRGDLLVRIIYRPKVSIVRPAR